MATKVLSYTIYGGKSIFKGMGSSPYSFETRTCDHTEECSLYKNGQCAKLDRLDKGCPFCKTQIETAGYRSLKGAKLYSKYKELKEALNEEKKLISFNGIFWKVGDLYCFNLRFVNLYRNKENNNIALDTEFFQVPDKYKFTNTLSKEEFTVELFNKLVNAKPRAIMGEIIQSYADKIVPQLKLDITKADEELAKKFGIEPINYVGKTAILRTLKAGITCWDVDKKYQLEWDGKTITVLNTEKLIFSSLLGKYHSGVIKMIPNDRLKVIIEDNSWVLPETIIS